MIGGEMLVAGVTETKHGLILLYGSAANSRVKGLRAFTFETIAKEAKGNPCCIRVVVMKITDIGSFQEKNVIAVLAAR